MFTKTAHCPLSNIGNTLLLVHIECGDFNNHFDHHLRPAKMFPRMTNVEPILCSTSVNATVTLAFTTSYDGYILVIVDHGGGGVNRV